MKKVIKASTQRRWVPFAFAVALLCSAWLPLSAFATGEVVETQNVNHVRSQGTRMSAQPAGGKFSADKAADGKDDSGDHHDSRWSTSDELPAKDESTYLQATFAKPTRLSYFKIIFETRAEGAPPTPSNVKGFELQYKETDDGPWRKATEFSRTQTVEGGGYEAVVKLKLDQPINAKAVRLTKFDVLKGSTEWNSVSVAEFEAYTNEQADAVDTENVNHVQGATAKANAFEADNLGADKAIDGKRGTRWSSGTAKPEKNTSTYLEVDLKATSKIGFLDIEFEERTVDVKPSNVKAFDIQYQAPGSSDWVPARTVSNVQSGSGYEPRVRVTLEAPIVAKKIRLTNFDIATVPSQSQWNGVSVVELEAYTNVQTVNETLESVVSKLNRMGDQTVAADVTQIEAPEVPAGFTIELNGADFEQVIGKGGTVHHPLADKVVQVSWKVSKDGTDEKAITNDIAYEVKGAAAPAQGKNAKPTVVPEIQEWFSNSTDKLGLDALTAVTYRDASLKSVVDEFVADYKDFTGKTLTASQGAAKAGAFNFTLGDPAGDKLLGEEGYTMQIQADRIDVAAPAITGNMYAMQTILQMTKTETDGFPVGQMRDYPRFPVRGFMWDIARKPISLEMVGNAARTMRYYKMNDLQLHLSDNLIFLENYGNNEADQWGAYSAFRLESGLSNNGVSPTAKDYSITKAAMRDFIKTQRSSGMNVVPEIDMPAHAVAFTRVWPELAVKNTKVTTSPAGKNRSAIDHLDVRKPEARKLIRDIFDDYTTGASPVFDTDTVVHVGADEFIIPNGRPSYCEFYNDLVPHLLDSGHTPRIWGSFDSSWLAGGGTEPASGEGVQMDIWSLGWANPKRMFDKGFSLINILDNPNYMVPNGGGNRGAYGDYLDTKNVYNSLDPNKFGNTVLPSSDPRILGAGFAIWNDNIDTNACGLSEADEYARFFDALPVYAENNWAPTGQEKGKGNAGHENLYNIVKKTGDAPRVNPHSKASKNGDSYAEYSFDNGLADASKNGRDLKAGKNATVENGKLNLAGGASYVESPLDKIGTGTSLSFDIELTRPACPGDILFEADAPYGTLDIRVMDNGKLGFTRELYNYYFDYKLPVGKKVHVEIVTATQKTTLKVDGETIGEAIGSFYNEFAKRVTKDGIGNSTFTLPLQRIGSKTRGIAAEIDNIKVAPASTDKPVNQYNKAKWQARTNSWTQTGESAGGHLSHALDGNPATIWHSNWQPVTAENVNGDLKVSKMIYAEFDFDKGYDITQFSFTPRGDVGSGFITKATLKVKNTANGEYKTVATDQVFRADSKKKTFTFDEQTVYGVRLEITDANEHGGHKYVAVSEFDIANTPARTNTVYAHGKSYAAGTDGALDLATGKAAGQIAGSAEDLDASKPVYRAEVKSGTTVTLTAEQVDGLEFVGWFAPCSKEPVSTDASCKVTADHNVALEARYKRIGGDPIVPPAPDPEPQPDPEPEPEPAPQPDPEQQPGDRPGDKPVDKPVDKPGSKPSGQSDDKLVATGDISMAMVGTALVGGMGLVVAGAKRRRR